MKVVVTDADDKKALAAVRALGRRGVHVCAAGSNRLDQSLWSKYAAGTFLYPNPVRDGAAFTEALLEFLRRERFDCVLAMSDYTTLLLSRGKREFERVTNLPFADHETLQLARDKPKVLEIAARLGIPVPETHCPRSLDEVERLAPTLTYPRVVKYRKGTGAVGLRYARTPEELVRQFAARTHERDAVFEDDLPMIQEYIPGPIHDVCLLFNRGEPRAANTHVRAKTLPPTGGRGVVDRTTDEPELREAALCLCREIVWQGPAQVEFKVDPRDGRARLMEINTRFWGGLGPSIEAGIDFAWLACRMAVDGDVKPVWNYRVGLTYRWFFPGEFLSAWKSKHRFSALLDWLRLERGARYDLWPSDPLPHLVKAGRWLYGSLRSRGR